MNILGKAAPTWNFYTPTLGTTFHLPSSFCLLPVGKLLTQWTTTIIYRYMFCFGKMLKISCNWMLASRLQGSCLLGVVSSWASACLSSLYSPSLPLPREHMSPLPAVLQKSGCSDPSLLAGVFIFLIFNLFLDTRHRISTLWLGCIDFCTKNGIMV